jgi:hypothetical protein
MDKATRTDPSVVDLFGETFEYCTRDRLDLQAEGARLNVPDALFLWTLQ